MTTTAAAPAVLPADAAATYADWTAVRRIYGEGIAPATRPSKPKCPCAGHSTPSGCQNTAG